MKEPKVVDTIDEATIDQKMNKLVQDRILNRAKWNRAIKIKNPRNFFNGTKGIYSVKFDNKNNIWYYILRPEGVQEPTIKTMNQIMDGGKEKNFLFLASETKFNHHHVLGQMIIKYEL